MHLLHVNASSTSCLKSCSYHTKLFNSVLFFRYGTVSLVSQFKQNFMSAGLQASMFYVLFIENKFIKCLVFLWNIEILSYSRTSKKSLLLFYTREGSCTKNSKCR